MITSELEEKFNKYPLNYNENNNIPIGEALVIAKFFNPTGGGTWLIEEASKEDDGSYTMFGYCHLGDDDMAEFGYVNSKELEEYKGLFELGVEIDKSFKECNIIEALKGNGFKVPNYLNSNEEELL